MIEIRPLQPLDILAVASLEAEAYEPALHESVDALHRLVELFPAGALGAFDGERLCGYAFGVPLVAGTHLELRRPLAELPARADMFYVHDVAVAPTCRGRGVGRLLAERLIAVGIDHGFNRFELVSVQGSDPFWGRFGFVQEREFEYAPGSRSVAMSMRVRS